MLTALLPALLFVASPAAVAGAPDRVAWTTAEGTEVPDLALAPSGRYVAFIEQGSNELRLLDTVTWNVRSNAACEGATPIAGLAAWDTGTGDAFFVGCSDGTVDRFDVTDGSTDHATDRIEVSTGSVLGLAISGDNLVVVEEQDGGSNPAVHAVELSGLTVDSGESYPSTLGHSGFTDIGATSSYAVIAHGGDNVSKVQVSTGGATIEESGGAAVKCTDLDVYDGDSSTVLLAGGTYGVGQFQLGTNEIRVVIEDDDGISNAAALAILEDDVTSWVVVGDTGADDFLIFEFDTGTGTPGDIVVRSFAFPTGSAGAPTDMVGVGGYAYAGTDDGELWVLTDRPWVEVQSVQTSRGGSSVVSGDEVTLIFGSDMAGGWELRLGAETDDGGTLLDSGEIEADGSVSTTIAVDGDWIEGANLLRVVVDDGETTGHAGTELTVDNPPSSVVLTDADVGFGDERVTLEFDGVDDADLARYDIYLALSEFDPDEWGSGGPDFDGFDAIENPIALEAEPGGTVFVEISPLTNGQTYYVAVRAVDSGGLEGPMSNVVTARPRATAGAAGLADETGGFCGTSAPLTALGALLAAMVGVTRRRTAGATMVAAVAVLLLGTSSTASAASGDKISDPRTKAILELRMGPVWYTGSDGRYTDGNSLNDVYGQRGNNLILLEGGPSWRGIVEGRFGIGLYRRKGSAVAVDDLAASTDEVRMDAFPLTADLLLRLDVLNEQIVVPFGGVGASYWLWREVTDLTAEVGQREALGGGKPGWHTVLGAQLLLDPIQRSRASTLETRFGIHDSYLTVEYRDQVVGEWTDGLEFSGTSITVGIRLNY